MKNSWGILLSEIGRHSKSLDDVQNKKAEFKLCDIRNWLMTNNGIKKKATGIVTDVGSRWTHKSLDTSAEVYHIKT